MYVRIFFLNYTDIPHLNFNPTTANQTHSAARRLLEPPHPQLLWLDLRYDPERALRRLQRQHGVTAGEMENVARMCVGLILFYMVLRGCGCVYIHNGGEPEYGRNGPHHPPHHHPQTPIQPPIHTHNNHTTRFTVLCRRSPTPSTSSTTSGALHEETWVHFTRLYLSPGLARRIFRRLLARSRCVGFVVSWGVRCVKVDGQGHSGNGGVGLIHPSQPPPPSPYLTHPSTPPTPHKPTNTKYKHHTHSYGGAEEAHALPLADFAGFLCLASRGRLDARLRFLFDVRERFDT